MLQTVSSPPINPAFTANAARRKLEEMIDNGRRSAEKLVKSIFDHQPTDFLVKTSALTFALHDKRGPAMLLKEEGGEPSLSPIHSHALNQLADRLDIPRSFVERLRTGSIHEKALLIHILNQLAWTADGRALVRVSKNEVRGVVSDRFRRMDSRPLIEAFLRAIKHAGAIPYNGLSTDVSYSIKAVLPVVHEPAPGETIAFGVELCNSDFGARALNLSLFVLRIRCANLAVFEQSVRKVHLGARLGEDAVYTQKTYDLDTATLASMIHDVVRRNLLPERLETTTGMIRQAASQRVSPDQLAGWLKKNLSKAEAGAVSEAFNSPDIERLPAGQSRYRFAQALSLIAAQHADPERRLDLERLAGAVIADPI